MNVLSQPVGSKTATYSIVIRHWYSCSHDVTAYRFHMTQQRFCTFTAPHNLFTKHVSPRKPEICLLSLQKNLPWHRLLTQRLTSDIKLVGPVISCEGSPFQGNVSDHWRTNPHVQSYVLAMDQEALQILKKDNTVLNCYNDRWDAVYFGELGSSLAVLKAGKNIDSLISK